MVAISESASKELVPGRPQPPPRPRLAEGFAEFNPAHSLAGWHPLCPVGKPASERTSSWSSFTLSDLEAVPMGGLASFGRE